MTSSDQLEMINLQELKRTKKAKEETKERANRFSLIDLQEWNTMYMYRLGFAWPTSILATHLLL